MEYREIKTKDFLSNFVKCFWLYNNPLEDTEHTILPDGYFDLIFEIDNKRISKVYLTGVWTKPVNVKGRKNVKLIGIRFKLIAAEYIFKHSLKDILDTSTPLPVNFWGVENFPIEDFEKFTSSLLLVVNDKLKNAKEIDERKLRLFQLLYENKGSLNISQLTQNVHWSSRQINRYFNKQYGFSLIKFSNILKCRSSYPDIAKGKLFPKQYYDQPHFIKSVKRYTGVTPKELYKNKNDRFLQLFTLKSK